LGYDLTGQVCDDNVGGVFDYMRSSHDAVVIDIKSRRLTDDSTPQTGILVNLDRDNGRFDFGDDVDGRQPDQGAHNAFFIGFPVRRIC
jgi:hypothetical protein